MSITIQDKNLNSYIEVMGSKSKLLDGSNNRYKNLSRLINVGKIKKTLFIFDCDFEEDDRNCNGMKNSERCFENLKQELKWTISIDVYIFNRNLDYFLLETIKEKKCYKPFDKLERCLEVEEIKKNKKPIANLYRDLYPHPQFDFSHPEFNELKEKLKNLFKE